MPPTLEEGQEIKRIIYVYGIGDCELTMGRSGMKLRYPGSREYVSATWVQVLRVACSTSANVPCWLADDPFKLLEQEKAKVEKNRAKREAKKEGK
jgi:hypothetical protein